MKANAIIRIVLFSLLILILLGILLAGIGFSSFRFISGTGNSAQEAEPNRVIAREEAIRVSADSVRELEIDWVAGDIILQPADVDAIVISESGVSNGEYAMVCKQSGDELTIQFTQESIRISLFGNNTQVELSKDLTILVPRGWACETLEVNAAAATLEVKDLTIQQVEFDGASGTCRFHNCSVDKLDLDTASGDVTFSGSLNILDCDAASAGIYAQLSNVPARMDMDTMSGDLEITLPEHAGFTVSIDSISGDFSTDFETSKHGDRYVCGDGSCHIQVDAMSGDVAIWKNK